MVVIAGPTAVGKTALSIELAKQYHSVILSADSRQFYKEMSIGTAKPSEDQLTEVNHYFINTKKLSLVQKIPSLGKKLNFSFVFTKKETSSEEEKMWEKYCYTL